MVGSTMNDDWVAEVDDFWFKALSPEDWFKVDPILDRSIRQRFDHLYRELAAAPRDAVMLHPRMSLSAIIVLDQFPRNMFRGSPEAFATDKEALAIALASLDLGFDSHLTEWGRVFLYMPLQHSEQLALQERSVALYEHLGLEEPLKSARQHKAVIERFGRFPHRNPILGRISTRQELDFIVSTRPF